MCDEDWINVALSDDSVVVELLLRLHRDTSPQTPSSKNQPPCLDVDWTVRQRRSRSVPRHRGSEGKDEPTRASPTTPLSWSCATSASCGGGGDVVDVCEESSGLIKLLESSRSKKAITLLCRPFPLSVPRSLEMTEVALSQEGAFVFFRTVYSEAMKRFGG